jgi:co-chaperonin GroES (HSP10)
MQAVNDNIFIIPEKVEDIKSGEIVVKEANRLKIIKAEVTSLDETNAAVIASKVKGGDTILVHKSAIVTDMIGRDEISYVKAQTILGIV